MSRSKSSPPATSPATEEAIRTRAYFLWEADGRPDGRHEHYWQLAAHEASLAMIASTVAGTEKALKGKVLNEAPAGKKSKSDEKPAKLKSKVVEAVKAVRKAATRPRAAVKAK